MSDVHIIARGRCIATGCEPFIFGILNCTPDSFSDGGRYIEPADAIDAGVRMAEEGADVLDVGGESTRPGSQPVDDDEQIRRTREVVAALAKHFGADGPAISIDTRSSKVAAAAIEAGARIVNDISALRGDERMADLVSRSGAGVILMHMQGTPATMQTDPRYDDAVGEIKLFLSERIEAAANAGIPRERIIADPGIGFGKTEPHNLEILRRIDEFRGLGVSLMVGTSRKRFIARLAGDSPERRLWGTLGSVAACVLAGVECLRVHDVAACRAAADVCAAIRGL